MAFMGYETPVEIPSMGVYNTDLMKMYIAGIKDQYEKGQQEMKDFMKQYADFYSDIPGATDAYNQMTIGGARNMIDQMTAAGIDPYKSPEARAAISRYIASVPTGALNEMKRSAENAKAYKQMEAKMKANGTWGSDDFQRFVLGGKLLEEWDSSKPFTATSPYEYKDLDALTAQQFAPFKAQENLGPSRDGYKLMGTRPERIQEAIIAAIADLPNSAQGQYQIDLAKRQVMAQAAAEGRQLTPEQLQAETNKQLYENVKLKADKFFQPKEEEDSWSQKKYEIANSNHQKALDRAQSAYQFNILHGDGSDGTGSGSGGGSGKNNTYSTPLSVQYATESDSKVNEQFAQFSNNRLWQFVDRASDYREKHPTDKIKTKKQSVAWWQKALSDPEKYGLVDSNGKETKLLKDWYARTGMIVGITTKSGKVVRGEKDLQHFDAQDNLATVFRGRTVGARTLSSAADKMYKKYMFEPTSNEERKVLNNQLTGTDKKQTIAGESGQYRIFQGDRTIQFTPYRRASLFNGGGLIPKAMRDFNEWLQSGVAQMVQRNTNSKGAMLPRNSSSYSYELSRFDQEYDNLKHGKSVTVKNATNREMASLGNNRAMDITGYGDIKMSDFRRFVAYTMNKDVDDVSNEDEKFYLSALGLTAYNTYGARSDVKDGKFIAGNIEYIRIPITKSINQ